MSQHRKTPGYPQSISPDYVHNVSWCVLLRLRVLLIVFCEIFVVVFEVLHATFEQFREGNFAPRALQISSFVPLESV